MEQFKEDLKNSLKANNLKTASAPIVKSLETKKNISRFLVKIDRLSAWVLLTTMFLYFISGYGMTKGIINSRLATQIHNDWLPILLIIAFSLHTSYAIHLALKRWRIWNNFAKILLIGFYVLFFIFFCYLDMFYEKNNFADQNKNSAKIQNDSANEIQSSASLKQDLSPQKSLPAYSLSEIAKHNNPKDCWIIINDTVYDISNYVHSGPQSHIYCGQDNTEALTSAHGKKYLDYFDKNNYKIGVLKK